MRAAPYPESPLIKQIAGQWRDILARAAGEIGQIAITKPVLNPFVVGNPVHGSLFVGWEEVLQRLEELWGSDPTIRASSVILYGHRRMGKSSVLQNLGQRFGAGTIVAQFTMQRLGRVRETREFLFALAISIHEAIEDAGDFVLPEPDEGDFTRSGYLAFNQYLRLVKGVIKQRRVILTIDEFELIEKGIEEGQIEAELLDFLRGLIHSEPWFTLALASLHTLEEMTEDYWNPLYASVTPVRVSFLNKSATGQLLANPSDDFPLDFTRATVDRVYKWVQGQPYLTQLIGHTLARRYNRSVFEEGRPREARFTPEDVDDVVQSHDFYE